jgi:hypothetical protein
VSTAARNVLIIIALGAVVAFVPGGGHTAAFIQSVLIVGISATIVLLLGRFYRENRVTIFGLGDKYRAMLYGAVGTAVFAMAARPKLFETGVRTLVWFVLLAGASAAVYAVWRHYREYGI